MSANTKPKVIRRGGFTATIYTREKRVTKPDGKKYAYPFYRLAYHLSGKKVTRDFGNLADASAAGNDVVDAQSAGRSDALAFTAEQRGDYAAATRVLEPFGLNLTQAATQLADALGKLPAGVTLAEVVANYVRRHPSAAPSVTVADAVEALLQDRERDKCSDAYLSKLRSHLNTFARSFRCNLADAEKTLIAEWLRNLRDSKERQVSNRTRLNYHGSIVTLLKFALSCGWVHRDHVQEVAEIPLAKAECHGEVGTFTPSEIRRLLEAAPDDIRASLAIGAFAGLRTEELHRLEWQDVRLAERVIIVGADKAKTASRRVVPIADNLALWLAPLIRAEGSVDPSPTSKALTHRWRRVGERVGVSWKHNALRHSFISYRVAVAHDPAKVAFEAGNSPSMIHRHYRALVTEAQGHEWFAVVPATQHADVVPMISAA